MFYLFWSLSLVRASVFCSFLNRWIADESRRDLPFVLLLKFLTSSAEESDADRLKNLTLVARRLNLPCGQNSHDAEEKHSRAFHSEVLSILNECEQYVTATRSDGKQTSKAAPNFSRVWAALRCAPLLVLSNTTATKSTIPELVAGLTPLAADDGQVCVCVCVKLPYCHNSMMYV